MRDILRDPDRPGGPLDLLNLNFTVFVAVPGAQQFFAFTQCAKEPKVAPEVSARDPPRGVRSHPESMGWHHTTHKSFEPLFVVCVLQPAERTQTNCKRS